MSHDLFTDSDANIPNVILDRNGTVALRLCKKCGAGESELDVQGCLDGPTYTELEQELAATKQKLEAAEQAIRESQEQEPVGSFVFNEENGYWKQVDKAWAQKLPGTKLYKQPVIIPQSAEQLHIKKLREALEEIASYRGHSTAMLHVIAQQALAKQPDTRALDKALLEAEIKTFEKMLLKSCNHWDCNTDFKIKNLRQELEAELAELNKE